jgi:hypothetical protein
MAFPRTWSEELIAEYLELKGYFVKTGHPIPIGGKGGRKEIDVLGIKVEENKLEILQVEVGQPSASKTNLIALLKKKFDPNAVGKEIKKIASEFGFKDNYEWKKWFIDPGYKEFSNDLRKIGKEEGIELKTLRDLEIKDEIKKWKENHKTSKWSKPALPENLWLLKLLENWEK